MDIVSHQKQLGTRFDFVGADGLYGNSYQFQRELQRMDLLFVLEIHDDQYLYAQPPVIAIPDRTSITGRKPSRYKATGEPIEVRELAKT